MRHISPQRLLLAVILLFVIVANGTFSSDVEAQGGIHLRQPFAGTYRLTAYVDHRSPGYTYDGNVVVYNGEERPNCPECGESWTTQGPYCYDGHDGIDYALPCGTSVLAAATGTVIFEGWEYGYTIKIDHGNGYITWYAHLQPNSFLVGVGDQVARGQQIALSGTSGTGACHLHFGVYHNNIPTDPFGWRGNWSDPLSGGPAVCLWGDGQCFEIIVEDESDWFYKYGTGWDWDCHGNGWTMRRVANQTFESNNGPYGRWRPHLPYRGLYAVYSFIPAVHATTTNAQYIAQDRYHTSNVPVNQLNHSDEWVYLGTYDFWEGQLGSVKLNNVTGEADHSREVGYDSIKFVQYRVHLPIMLTNYP